METQLQELIIAKEILQGKCEIASNILHDIGNAMVGFGSHINRIKRSLDKSKPANLQKMVEFFILQRPAIAAAIGAEKADAIIKMISGISEEQKFSQDEIQRSVTDQLNIITHIQEILHIQRQYANGYMKELKPINLRTIINDCTSMLFASFEKRDIRVNIDIPSELPAFRGDRTRIMQVILNILKNSIEALDIRSAQKNISITVSAHADWITLEIKDNGHGFDTETSKHLFNRGFTTKASGSGLGLNSCRAIIEDHEGNIDITSPGIGKGALTAINLKSTIQNQYV
jgi:signal transduction histidine kinase